jgi:hypothetical protein
LHQTGSGLAKESGQSKQMSALFVAGLQQFVSSTYSNEAKLSYAKMGITRYGLFIYRR